MVKGRGMLKGRGNEKEKGDGEGKGDGEKGDGEKGDGEKGRGMEKRRGMVKGRAYLGPHRHSLMVLDPHRCLRTCVPVVSSLGHVALSSSCVSSLGHVASSSSSRVWSCCHCALCSSSHRCAVLVASLCSVIVPA